MLYISRLRLIATFNEMSRKYLQDMIEKSDYDYNLHASSPFTPPNCNTE